MPGKDQNGDKKDLITLPCITVDCPYHVTFNPLTQPIPARKADFNALQGEVTIYLDCDNPISHRNKYKIKL